MIHSEYLFLSTKTFEILKKKSIYWLKVGYACFQKRFRKLIWAKYQKTCCQSAVRGVSTHDAEESTLRAHDKH